MADLSIRKGEPREQGMTRGREPFQRTIDPLRAWDPFQMIRDLMGSDVFGGMVAPASGMFAPDIEVKETKDAYVLTADLPGVKEQELEVNITGNRLAVSGKREEEMRDEGDRYFAYERTYGTFSRSFALPEGADMEHVKAELKDGVLRIMVPKKAEVQPRRVQIGAQVSGQPTGQQAPQGQPTQKKAA